MHTGRYNYMGGRLPVPVSKNPSQKTGKENNDESIPDGKKATNSVQFSDEAKLRPSRKSSNIPIRRKVSKSDEDQVSQPYRYLLPRYETGEKGKNKIPDERKTKINGKQPESQSAGKRAGPGFTVKAKMTIAELRTQRNNEWELQTRKIPLRRKATQDGGKTQTEKTTESFRKTSKAMPPAADKRHGEKSVIVKSAMSKLLERKGKKQPLNLPETCDGTVFPVCSKRSTDNIPSSNVLPVCRIPDKSEVIIMLRRRNSEPYPSTKCIQQCAESENLPIWNSNFYLWKSEQTGKPYWEVSLYKSNRSLSVLTSRAASGMLSLTPGCDISAIFQSDKLNPREKAVDAKGKWLRETSSMSDNSTSFTTLMDRGRIFAREPKTESKSASHAGNPPNRRFFSKDDQYKPPGHMFVYVKTSQKKLVTIEADNHHGENFINKKSHKLTKMKRLDSSLPSSVMSWHKKILLTATSVLFVIIGGFILFYYYLANKTSISNLTPPIPGLVHGS